MSGADIVVRECTRAEALLEERTSIRELRETQSQMGMSEFVGVMRCGGVPYEEAERSLKLFASEASKAEVRLPSDQRGWTLETPVLSCAYADSITRH